MADIRLYMRDVNSFPLLDEVSENDVALRAFDGDAEARNEIAQSNLRLVVKIANQLVGRGVELEDLIMEGNLGLLRSIDTYDPSVGVRFQTYAAPWIKRSMQEVVKRKSKTIKLPRSGDGSHVSVSSTTGTSSSNGDFEYESNEGEDSTLDRIVLREDIEAVLSRFRKLTERETRVVKMRFGMDPFLERMTLTEVGEILGVNWSYVRDIQMKALEKLSCNG